ncbi:MAG: LysE family translocator [Oligoflexales bacterium]|nr:LysE family translocator [Oligoflexales bacterium]
MNDVIFLPTATFLLAAFILAITPGQGLAFVVARTVAGGKVVGLASCIGTALGGCLHVLGALAGLSVLLAKSAYIFTLLKYLGAVYLIYLGIKTILSSSQVILGDDKLVEIKTRKAFIDGIVVETLNIKTAMFFLAFIPQFLNPELPIAAQFICLGLICVFFNTAVDIIAVILAEKIMLIFANQKNNLLTNISGVTLILLGISIATVKK